MSWWVIGSLVVGSFATKVLGVFGLASMAGAESASPSSSDASGPAAAMTRLIPAALFAALVAVQTFADGSDLVLDARVWGLAAAVVAVWRRAPFIVVVLVAMAVTAAVRWQT